MAGKFIASYAFVSHVDMNVWGSLNRNKDLLKVYPGERLMKKPEHKELLPAKAIMNHHV